MPLDTEIFELWTSKIDVSIYWKDIENKGKRIVRQIRDGVCAIRKQGLGYPRSL